ncbi:MAG TPA: amidohydrolase [Bacteroidales bacterium]|nr:amidohydrolase [Bacteroidales bacterium]HRZ48590.1 amidohydrolase [Bacteroidales bacterium]
MTQLYPRIKEIARIYHSETIAIRRHLHTHPELSGQEAMTAAFVANRLEQMQIPFRSGVGGFGLVAHIRGSLTGDACAALRADMDALPIEEKNDVSYRSQNPGVMHACGHDAHTAALLGAAKILHELRDSFGGTVKLIFQPSEERFPGGAKAMIAEGALMDPAPRCIFGAHVFPELEAGEAGSAAGPYMASTDEVYLTVKGKGGHAATPHQNTDPVVIGAQILLNLQQVVSRLAPPVIPTVLSFGRFIANGRTNIIPHEVKLEGTLRTFDEQWRAEAHRHITRIAQQTAASMDGVCEVFIDKGYPFLVNDPAVTELFNTTAKAYLGDGKVHTLEQRMTAEDFAYFAQHTPSCFYRIGTASRKKGITANLHTPEFNIDEKSLETASGLMAALAIDALAKG